jgi:hypothetical protein
MHSPKTLFRTKGGGYAEFAAYWHEIAPLPQHGGHDDLDRPNWEQEILKVRTTVMLCPSSPEPFWRVLKSVVVTFSSVDHVGLGEDPTIGKCPASSVARS